MRLTIRIPDDLGNQLREEAEEEVRSLNGQVCHILRLHYARRRAEQVEEKIPEIARAMNAPGGFVGMAMEDVKKGDIVGVITTGSGVVPPETLPPSSPQQFEKGAK